MPLLPGDSVPHFIAPALANPRYAFDSAAGRYLVLAVLSDSSGDAIEAGIARIQAARPAFDDDHASLFGLLPDRPEWRARVTDDIPGLRWLFDDGTVAARYQAAGAPLWVLSDPALRVLAVASDDEAERLLSETSRLPPPERHAGALLLAPVLTVPRVFEPDVCRRLIDVYDAHGGEASGFMREIEGKTRLVMDGRHKRRQDAFIEDPVLKRAVNQRLSRFLAPSIRAAFQFDPTRIERHLVACYDADSGGWFRPHRDNTTRGTAHRRFAVSINLNEDFEGGDLRFPEFGSHTYRPPAGGAVVFSCSLLHEATPVTRGRRYAFLPFFYDEAAAQVRRGNLDSLEV